MNLLIAALIAAGIFSFAGDKSVNLEEREAQVAASSHNMYHQDLNEASPLEQYLAGDVSRSGDPMTAFGGPGREITVFNHDPLMAFGGPGREITVFNHDPLMAFGGPGEEVSSEWAFAAAREATNFQEKDGVIVLKEVSSEWAFALADDAKNFQEKNGVIVAKVVDKDFRDYALRDGSRPEAPVVLAISATGAMGGILNYSNNSLLADNGKEIIYVP
jgi:hypothetical protein